MKIVPPAVNWPMIAPIAVSKPSVSLRARKSSRMKTRPSVPPTTKPAARPTTAPTARLRSHQRTSVDRQQVDDEHERLVRLDHAACPTRPVRHRRRNRQLAAAADAHPEDA